MKKSVFSLALLALMSLVLVSCPSAKQEESGKILRVGMINPNAKLDMHLYQWSDLMSISDHVVQPLFAYDDNLNVVPLLTTDYPVISEDGRLYTFTLKEGITFHDGSPMTSADVQFLFQRMFDASVSGQIAIASGSYDMIVGSKELMNGTASGDLRGFTIIDDRTFSIELEMPFAPFIQNLAMSYAGIISKNAYLNTADKESWGISTLIGSGPYTFKQYHHKDGVTLLANEHYWGGFRPAIDQLNFHFFDDPTTALLEYESGNIDIVELTMDKYEEYSSGRFASHIQKKDILGTYMIIVSFTNSPFSDVKVREAFAYALDRDLIVEQVYKNILDKNDNFLPKGIPGRNPNVKLPAYNPEKAKQLLNEAGYPNGIDIEASFRTGNQTRRQLWTLIQAKAKDAGFNITAREMDIGQHTELSNKGELIMQDAGWIASFPDADDLMYTFFHSSWSHLKSSNLKNDRVDELLDTARQSTDPEARRLMYEEVEQIVVGDNYAVYPYANIKKIYLVQPRVQNPVFLNGIGQYWMSDLKE
ncbi:ABC transporter substrate-binding protein [Entomospira culicis]|uniref:ABC transporter substrate-binding protein n=1 Tax=Entomospira culicis TaxID=2719989 RepID=A0A968GGN6_9SPIO|nr:ABC transporter substrate-binding protein [Entomospira culicis]NIZ19894.1 ABC transporter substrate-binding protein [Entomospira culicis]NIZ70149.1 ABC transporter substrate-binding protein [Entomospira culicis]WDI38076.1 ABC transporter substrate-binding protein [Entomospira culicis]WDI39699.1 ABC transporter substrate-binding protein [Entomospira culicis]